ncbi:MAG: Eco57I restriction-modification methylase domain-containing protein [Candidatus Hodarchaeota archaeon]
MDINNSMDLIWNNSRFYKKAVDILLDLYSELSLIKNCNFDLKQRLKERFDLIIIFTALLFYNPEDIPSSNGRKFKNWMEIYNIYIHPGEIFLRLAPSLPFEILNLFKESCQTLNDESYITQLRKIQWGAIANKLSLNFRWEPYVFDSLMTKKNTITLEIFDFITTCIMENKTPYKSKKGVVYTPQILASLITENALLSWINASFTNLGPFKSLSNFIKFIAKNDEHIKSIFEKKLGSIKIIDPTAGTGVFLLTAGNFLLNILTELYEKLPIQEIKLRIISKNLFGIDIDAQAVKVSKMKFWLWVTETNKKEPFDRSKFLCNVFEGNSLFGYQTFSQDYDKIILKTDEENTGRILIDNLYENEIFKKLPIYEVLKTKSMVSLIKHLSKVYKTYLKNPYFKYFIIEGEREQWNSLKNSLNQKLRKLTKYSISPENELAVKLYAVFSKPLDIQETEIDNKLFSKIIKYKIPQKFHWVVAGFSKFDLIIGNPPYIALTDLPLILRQQLRITFPKIYSGNNDLVYFFIYRALTALQENNGILAFLLPKYLVHSVYAKKIREFITRSVKIIKIQDISEFSVFHKKSIRNIILYLKKGKSLSDHNINYQILQRRPNKVVLKTIQIPQTKLQPEKWILVDSRTLDLLNRMKKVSNKVLQDVADISKGIETGCDRIFAPKDPYYFTKKLNIHNSHVKPWIKGKDIKRFFVIRTGREVLYAPLYRKTKIESNKKAMKYLESEKSVLLKRSRVSKYYLWRLGDERKTMSWALPKIITPYRSRWNTFAIDWHGSLSSKDVVWIIPKDSDEKDDFLLFLMSLLNSDVLSFFAINSIKDLGGLYEFYPKQIENFPLVIPGRNTPEFKTICELAFVLTRERKEKRRKEIEKELNYIIFKLYKLTELDISTINKSVSSETSACSDRNKQFSPFFPITEQIKVI